MGINICHKFAVTDFFCFLEFSLLLLAPTTLVGLYTYGEKMVAVSMIRTCLESFKTLLVKLFVHFVTRGPLRLIVQLIQYNSILEGTWCAHCNENPLHSLHGRKFYFPLIELFLIKTEYCLTLMLEYSWVLAKFEYWPRGTFCTPVYVHS